MMLERKIQKNNTEKTRNAKTTFEEANFLFVYDTA